LRQAGIKVDCYPEAAKLGKQLKYADRIGIQLVVILGSDEIRNNLVAIKDLKTGAQHTVARQDALQMIQTMLITE
jgi:histidyl-tRNA synthetase